VHGDSGGGMLYLSRMYNAGNDPRIAVARQSQLVGLFSFAVGAAEMLTITWLSNGDSTMRECLDSKVAI
jgi:hypothetical protein